MDNVFEQFDEAMDQEGLLKDIEAAENGESNYKEVPVGTYDVSVDKMELKLSKQGSPMCTLWFKINAGEFKNSLIFYNQVVTQGFQIHLNNEMLRSLNSSKQVEFKKYTQYAQLIDDIGNEIKNTKAYGLAYGKNDKGYNTYEITNVIDLETEGEEIPF